MWNVEVLYVFLLYSLQTDPAAFLPLSYYIWLKTWVHPFDTKTSSWGRLKLYEVFYFLSICYFLKPLHIFPLLEVQKMFLLLFIKKYTIIIIIRVKNHTSSAFDIRNVSETFGMRIPNNLNRVRNLLKWYPSRHFKTVKFTEVKAEIF